jgi:cytoskeletal protein CcmA (bactofilin family)
MWKPNPDEKPVSANPPSQPTLTRPGALVSSHEARPPAFRADVAAHIGKSVLVKGELSGSEDLYVDGEVEGAIALHNHTLVVGPNSRIRANISAREVVVHGKVEGNIVGAERVELKTSCVLSGDITTPRIIIEDGAFFKGSVDPQPERAKPAKTTAAETGVSSVAAISPQTSLLEHK